MVIDKKTPFYIVFFVLLTVCISTLGMQQITTDVLLTVCMSTLGTQQITTDTDLELKRKKQKIEQKKMHNDVFEERRSRLIETIKLKNSGMSGAVLLFANFEHTTRKFDQERHFYYLTGIEEPGTAIFVDLASGWSTLYLPEGMEKKEKWQIVPQALMQKDARALGFDEIATLEGDCPAPFFLEKEYSDLRERLSQVVGQGGKIFTVYSAKSNVAAYIFQRVMVERLDKVVSGLIECCEDITSVIFRMRHSKDEGELACLKRAIEITIKAQKAAAKMIKAGVTENGVRAAVEAVMVRNNSRPGFMSIVAGGEHATLLHHGGDDTVLRDGDLVVVDIGAECGCHQYSADMTRTYPVSGKFTERQRAVCTVVAGALTHVAQHAKPGSFFKKMADEDEKIADEERSLLHITKKFLEEKGGYDQHFPHGIGHHIGLDVHEDVDENRSTYDESLRKGATIALEPGVYIEDEKLGIRLEDNFLITETGAVCLSGALPIDPDGIERLMRERSEVE